MSKPTRIQLRRTKGWRKLTDSCHADVLIELANRKDEPT